MPSPFTTRAFFEAITVEGLAAPYNTLALKIYYPAAFGNSEAERASGVVPADTHKAPFPIVILLPGINIDPSGYGWLAKKLGDAGMVTVCFQFIAEEMPGFVNATPGIDLRTMTPDTYGNGPSSSTLTALLNFLSKQQKSGVLAGQLDLERIIVGGHSAGGMMAMLNADPDWFKGVLGCFAYGAHSGVSTALGWPENSLLPLPNKVPLLLMGGNQDGCIANSNQRYEKGGLADTCRRITDTFEQALGEQNGNNTLAFIEGANHFTPVSPQEHTTGRSFIDIDTEVDQTALRELLANIITRFIHQVCLTPAADNQISNPSTESFQAFLQQQTYISSVRVK